MLTGGAIEAIELNGSDALKQIVPAEDGLRRVDRHDEPDRAAGRIRSRRRAREGGPQADGSYVISGNKIFITYGDHDYTDNIVHLVLARTPDAPPGTKGISLFVVPKFLVNADGSLGARNDVRCVSLEHKLGIHASPTAVLAFGDHGGAVGHIVGEENRGLEYMFVMMNLARFGVGMQGVGIADRAYQRGARLCARARAGTRRRRGAGRRRRHHRPPRRAPDADDDARVHRSGARARLRHRGRARSRAPASGRRRAQAQARVRRADDPDRQGLEHRGRAARRRISASRCTAAWATSRKPARRSTLRDARITTIYEGTTGIQANDLVGRKIARDGGEALLAAIADDARDGAARSRLPATRSSPPSARACTPASTRCETPALVCRRVDAQRGPACGAGRRGPVSRARRHRVRRRAARPRRARRPRRSLRRRGRRRFPAREDRDRAPFRRSLPDAGARAARHRRRAARRACSRSPTRSSDEASSIR